MTALSHVVAEPVALEQLQRMWDDVDTTEQQRRARVLADAHRRRNIAWSLLTHPSSPDIPDLMPSSYHRPGEEQCQARGEGGYLCARLTGHTGRHAAGTGTRVTAVWSGGVR